MSFLQELKRRKVIRTLIAYLVAAAAIGQGTQLLVDGLDLPSWILRVVLIVEILALPVVIALAWAFDITAEGVERTDATATTSSIRIAWKTILPVVAVALVVIFVGAYLRLRGRSHTELDENLVAVMPFHVSGDPQIAYLREGMLDLLAAKLTGDGGPRAADPRAVMSALKQNKSGDEIDVAAATSAARTIGAGKVITGSIVGNAAHFTINAQLASTDGGHRITAEQQGSADSLLATVDRLTAKLLALQSGEGSQRLAMLTSTSLDALRAYLAGQAAYRSGHFTDAFNGFKRALEIDSTFALAAEGHIISSGWGESDASATGVDRSRRLLVANLDRLGAVDRSIALAVAGDKYPDRRSVKEKLAAWEAAIAKAPDRADAWFLYGDQLGHYGGLADVADKDTLAVRAFARALSLDSTHTPALIHLIDWAALAGDWRRTRQLNDIRSAHNIAQLPYQVNMLARGMGDSAIVRATRASLDTTQFFMLYFVGLAPVLTFDGVDDALSAVDKWTTRATTSEEKHTAYTFAHGIYLNLGMPAHAAGMLRRDLAVTDDTALVAALAVLSALYFDGDSVLARELAPALHRMAQRNVGAACVVAQWDLWHGVFDDVDQTITRLNNVPGDAPGATDQQLCALLLHAIRSALTRAPDAMVQLDALNNVLKTGPHVDARLLTAANTVAGRLYAGRNDQRSALRTASRQGFEPDHFYGLATQLHDAGRAANALGEKDRARRDYQHYLALHARAEPAIKSKDDAIRAELAKLVSR